MKNALFFSYMLTCENTHSHKHPLIHTMHETPNLTNLNSVTLLVERHRRIYARCTLHEPIYFMVPFSFVPLEAFY